MFTGMLGEVFSLNLLFKYVRSSSIHAWSTEPDHAKVAGYELANAEPSQGLHHQITWDVCSSEILHGVEW